MARHRAAHAEWKAGEKSDPEPRPPRLVRYMVEDASIEALQEVLRDDQDGLLFAPQGKVLVRRDELSEFLASMDRYSTGSSDRGAYLRLYNGGRFSIDRIKRGAFVANSWSGCILGGIQPEPIQRIAAQATDDGLLQRFMFDMPRAAGTQGADRAPDHPHRGDAYRALFPALAALRPACSGGTDRPDVVVLHRDAHAAREDIDQLAYVMANMPDVSERMQAALGKWRGLFARICLTFHLIEIAAARATRRASRAARFGRLVPTLPARRTPTCGQSWHRTCCAPKPSCLPRVSPTMRHGSQATSWPRSCCASPPGTSRRTTAPCAHPSSAEPSTARWKPSW